MNFHLFNKTKTQQTQSIQQSIELQQHLKILSLPSLDLYQHLILELEENLAIELQEPKSLRIDQSDFLNFYSQTKEAPFEQIPTKLHHSSYQILAQEIFASFDQEGFLQQEEKKLIITRHGEIAQKILEIFKEEALLGFEDRIDFWLHLLEKENNHPLACQILKLFKKELLMGDFNFILKKLELDFEKLKNEVFLPIKKLPLSPKSQKPKDILSHHVDAHIYFEQNNPRVDIQDILPGFSLNPNARLLDEDVKQFYKPHLNQLKMLIDGVNKRKTTLCKIIEFIAKHQKEYLAFEKEYPLYIDPKTIAEATNLHPSTVARALQNKVILTPRGMQELKIFATCPPLIENKLDLLKELRLIVQNESKKEPYSDDKLQKLLMCKGASISRRTVTKYRNKLNIPDARRRHF